MNDAFAGFAISLALCGSAAAFECNGVTGQAERAICASPAAKAADDAMNVSFAAVKARMDATQSASLLADQRDWLRRRNIACAAKKNDAVCYQRENESRVAYLSAKPKAGPGTSRPLVPFIVYRKGTPKSYETQLELFRFADAATDAEKRFNAEMDKIVADAPTSIDKDDRSRDTSSFSWSRSASIGYASDRLLSLTVEGSEYTGGAHPNSGHVSINLDMKSGRLLTIDDLLPRDKRAEIGRLCATQVAAQFKDKLREQGTDPDKNAEARDELKSLIAEGNPRAASAAAELANWTFAENSATVNFNPYEVAAYVYGYFDCDVPYATLRPLAKPAFPLP